MWILVRTSPGDNPRGGEKAILAVMSTQQDDVDSIPITILLVQSLVEIWPDSTRRERETLLCEQAFFTHERTVSTVDWTAAVAAAISERVTYSRSACATGPSSSATTPGPKTTVGALSAK